MENNGWYLGRNLLLDAGCAARGLPGVGEEVSPLTLLSQLLCAAEAPAGTII